MAEQTPATEEIPVGISACLMGEQVRYNGGHKRSRYCLEVLQERFRFEPFCPELEAGLGVPRDPVRLVGALGEEPRVVGTRDPSLDVTEALAEVSRAFIERHRHLRGFILMKGSPSCGLERVKVYHENGMPSHADAGAFVRELRRHFPELPLEEEARMNDAVLRENFITRVYAYDDWKRHVEATPSYHALLQFHSRQKYLLMAHHVEAYRELGRYLAESGKRCLDEVMNRYLVRFMEALGRPATRKTHANALMHVFGYLKDALDGETKQDLLAAIEDYRQGHVHLAVPIRMINHYVKRHGSNYVREQTYLDPHPYELGLRNAI
ncbi:YbgA family protein [Halomonas sp. C05BenzN]|uniref:YbgA family protein n=1 Tax=Halomonas sp. C05BenzN TaxID=3411041 RepID=UPI003B929EAB